MPTRQDDAPLILTALLDPESFAILDDLRRRSFPAALNKVPAHISLFHHLPGAEVGRVLAEAEEACAGVRSFDLMPTGVRFLGRGVALAYDAPELRDLHGRLARRWSAWLTPQDRQTFRAHVTIQNKAEPSAARALFERIKEQLPPACRIEGISVWRYRGGPWDRVGDLRFGMAQ